MGIPLIARKGETEEAALKRWLSYSFIAVTIFLMCLNVSGAWIGSHGNIFYTGAIAGAELFVALALGALMFTRNWLRFGVGIFIFVVGVWITLENGKMAVTASFNDVFTGTPTELREKADLADKRATELDKDASDGKTTTTTNLTAIRNEVAELRAEQRTLAGSDIYGIQRILQSYGFYSQATLDGIRGEETERGIIARGDQIRKRLEVLAELEQMATAPPPAAVTPEAETAVAVSPAEAKRAEAIELRKQAKEVEERTVWMNILLVGLESIRSLALWVFLMDGVITISRLLKRADDQLALAQANVRIAEVNAQIAALQKPAVVAAVTPAAPEPVEIEPVPVVEPPPAPEPEELDLTELAPPPVEDRQETWRPGLLAANHAKAAKKARDGSYILVPSLVARDADAQAAKMAAE